jgi:asparagine synthase (glutamine-hydrolysing)
LDQFFQGRPFIVRENPLLSVATISDDRARHVIDDAIFEGASRLTVSEVHQISDLIELQSHYWRFGRADVVEEVHPLLSQPILESCLRTRMHWYCHGGTRRGLAKAAFSDLLPESILTRRSKSSNSSHWLKLVLAELPTYRELLLEGALARQGLLDRAKVQAMLTPLGLVEGKYFSELMNLISVERWVRDAANPSSFRDNV